MTITSNTDANCDVDYLWVFDAGDCGNFLRQGNALGLEHVQFANNYDQTFDITIARDVVDGFTYNLCLRFADNFREIDVDNV